MGVRQVVHVHREELVMAIVSFNATPRDGVGKGAARTLRSKGEIPAVIYGHGREPQALSLNARDLDKMLGHIQAESTVIEVTVGGATSKTLIREIQRHPIRRQILHVDFQALVAGEKVTVSIPIVLQGIPEGVRLGGGVLDQTLREIEIEVDPSSIPDHIEFDVTNLVIGDSVHISDLKVPEGVEVLDDPETSVAVVAAPRAVIEETAAVEAVEGAEGVAAEPEVIGKGLGDDEEGEGGEESSGKKGGDSSGKK
ncbi:MAG: large subunit ribosomal protein [Gemmatimonadaceae bacterium]|nr:large subunit ribosomal protein [Gemmatimonadaceae bacterium]MEA2764376.1 large subunit ribosomal protein [Gemmatimonadaceae bacterium]